jgi:hypothetical protein
VFSSGELLEGLLVAERSELVALSLVELVLELDPVKTECVEEALHYIHRH